MYKWIYKNRSEVTKLLRTHKSKLMIILLLKLFGMVISVYIPLLNMKLVNLFVYESVGKTHIIFAVIYITVLAASGIVGYIENILMRIVSLQIQENLQQSVIEYCISKKKENYDIEELGDIDARIKLDAPIFQQYLMNCLFEFPFVFVRIACIAVIMFVMCPEAALVMCIIQVLIYCIQKKMFVRLDEESQTVRSDYMRLNESIADIVSKMQYICKIGAERYISKRFVVLYGDFINDSIEQTKCGASTSVFVNIAMNINMILILAIGSIKIFAGNLQVGALLSMIQYAGYFQGSISSLNGYMTQMHGESKKIDNISEVLGFERNLVQADIDISAKSEIKEICLENVSFSYDNGGDILKEADASFALGKLNCVMGPSGSGKSTLFKLLMDDYHLQEGKIKCFNKTGDEVGVKNNISLVPQDNIFFTDSIFENLVLGQEIKKEKVYDVCRNCSIYDDIVSLENGFDTVISNGINNFSGGQIKRLSIARSILRNKDILLLDEPTAGLDSDNADCVMECIRKYSKNKLVIMITHDITAANLSDVLYKFENKKLVRQRS
ncbi:MAG: ABC transporter ATP-binding protein/permease [Lachnospiraceae bacterium]|nr:ABC transporter ATP-binding protein/permease [Lachnospiraceae bacterium]